MRQPLRYLLILTLLALSPSRSGWGTEVEAPMPDALRSPVAARTEPIWVSARHAILPNGKLNPKDLPEYSRRTLDQYLLAAREKKAQVQNDEPCSLFLGRYVDNPDPKPASSLSDLIENSLGIYQGRITGRDLGFLDGSPGTLLRLHIETSWKSNPEYSDKTLYIFYPVAQIELGGETLCSRNPGYSFRPEIGDRLLLFGYYAPLDASRTLIFPEAEHLFFEDRQRHLFLPQKLRGDVDLTVARSLSDIAEFLTAEITIPASR